MLWWNVGHSLDNQPIWAIGSSFIANLAGFRYNQ